MTQDEESTKPKSMKLNIILFFLKPYKLRITALFILSIVVGVLEAVNIAAIYPILSSALKTGAEQSNFVFSLLRASAELLPVSDIFVAYCIIFLIIAVLTFAAKEPDRPA